MPFINLPLPITTCETKGGSKYRLLDNGQAQRYINRFWGWDEQKQDFAGVGNKPDGNRWNACHYTNAFKQRNR